MTEYTPPYTISNTMLELVSSISEKVGQISSHKDLQSRPHLRRNNRIRSIHSSLKIEANSLSLNEVRNVIDGHAVIGDRNEIQEVKNAYAAYEKIEEVNPYDIRDLQKMHGIMTASLIADSGKFRKGEEGVFSGEQCIFVAPPAKMVPSLMQDLFDWMNRSSNTLHPLILSSVFHYEFVFIHPFADGNGRMARLWQTILLTRWREIFEYIPLESKIESFQEQYYDAIAKCHRNGNSDVFIEFMLHQIDAILDDVIVQIHRSNKETTEYVRRLLDVMEMDVPYTANDLMERLNLKSKETFRKNYINPAMEQGYAVMEFPDKPKSRNQRYIRKG